MPSFVYSLRGYEQANTCMGINSAPHTTPPLPPITCPPPVRLARPVDASAASLLGSCRRVTARGFSTCTRRLQRWHWRSGIQSTPFFILSSLLGGLVPIFLLIAAFIDRFVIVQSSSPLLPPVAQVGAFHYCALPPSSSPECHTIDSSCSAGSLSLSDLLGHEGETVSCSRFDGFRACFLLALILAVVAAVSLCSLLLLSPSRLHRLCFFLYCAVSLLLLLSLVMLLPMLPPSSASAASATLAASCWLELTAMPLAVLTAALLCLDSRRRRREREAGRAQAESSHSSREPNSREEQSIMMERQQPPEPASLGQQRGVNVTASAAQQRQSCSSDSEDLEEDAEEVSLCSLSSEQQADTEVVFDARSPLGSSQSVERSAAARDGTAEEEEEGRQVRAHRSTDVELVPSAACLL